MIRYGSVCSGIEAATVAWGHLGWKCAWFSEIDPFCSALLKHHYPEVKNHGDFTRIGADAGPIDLLVGGTPCQAFSVAGQRGGLDDARGNLTLGFLKLAGRLRPRWLVWENVPGVLSIDGGRTFGTVLGGLAELGYGFAYRILDAQFFGVPQRRRRVFVVGYLGAWQPAAAVLFERHCLSGYPAPRREKGQGVAPTISARTKGGGGLGTDFDLDGGLLATEVAVRRLTPRECERLQGFEDDYTLIPNYHHKIKADDIEEMAAYLGIPLGEARAIGATPDGPRYKAIGNSMAVPCMEWIGSRIAQVGAL